MERRRIVEETLEAGASMARVALKYGVNANQVFQWRRLYRDGKLGTAPQQALKLLPVSIAEEMIPVLSEIAQIVPTRCGAIHTELLGEVRITLEGNVDPGVVRAVPKDLRQVILKATPDRARRDPPARHPDPPADLDREGARDCGSPQPGLYPARRHGRNPTGDSAYPRHSPAGEDAAVDRGPHPRCSPIFPLVLPGMRDRALLLVGYTGGLRRSELAAFTVGGELGLHRDSVGGILKRAVARAGFDPSGFAGHSLQAGFATQAARNGASAFDIMRQTGHHSITTVSAMCAMRRSSEMRPPANLGCKP